MCCGRDKGDDYHGKRDGTATNSSATNPTGISWTDCSSTSKCPQLNFQVSKDFDYDIWDETAIMVGEHRAHAIAEALHKADFGLFLVSMAWLAKFEPGGSLSVFVKDDGKPVIPVVLKPVVQEHHQLHGLGVRQLFRVESSRGVLKCYAECRTDAERDRIAQSLFQQIEQRLRRGWPLGAHRSASHYVPR